MTIKKTLIYVAGAATVAVLALGPTGFAGAAHAMLREHVLAQQSRFFGSKGPMVQAVQSAGLELRLDDPDLDVGHDRRARVLVRQNEYACYDPSAFGTPIGAQLVVNTGAPIPLVWVDPSGGEPGFFEGWVLAQDLTLWGNSGQVLVWDQDGREVEFSLVGIF